MERGAIISSCGQYRYRLWRIWDRSRPLVLFIMLNPSSADAAQDDPTIRRLIGFCQRWRAGGFYVGNLNPYRTHSPEELFNFLDGCTVGERIEMALVNQHAVKEMVSEVTYCVAAWGVNVYHKDSKLPSEYTKLSGGKPFYCIGMTKKGYPKHPLYLPYEAQLLTWPDGQPIQNHI